MRWFLVRLGAALSACGCWDTMCGGGLWLEIRSASGGLAAGAWEVDLVAEGQLIAIACSVSDPEAEPACTVGKDTGKWYVRVDDESQSGAPSIDIELLYEDPNSSEERGPSTLDVRVRLDGLELFDATLSPEYEEREDTPGKARCGVCYSASEDVVLDGG